MPDGSVIGARFIIGLLLAHNRPGDAFGAGRTMAVILVWLYYAAMVVLFAAELTREWAIERGGGIASHVTRGTPLGQSSELA